MPTPAPRPIPEGMNTLTAQLWFNGNGREALAFYQRALGAELTGPVASGADGKTVMHALLKIGNSHLMVADAFSEGWERGPRDGCTVSMHVYVEDCDVLFNRAREAGCVVETPLMDAFWGDRMGKLRDPFGHFWSIATRRWALTVEEMAARQREFLESARDRSQAMGRPPAPPRV